MGERLPRRDCPARLVSTGRAAAGRGRAPSRRGRGPGLGWGCPPRRGRPEAEPAALPPRRPPPRGPGLPGSTVPLSHPPPAPRRSVTYRLVRRGDLKQTPTGAPPRAGGVSRSAGQAPPRSASPPAAAAAAPSAPAAQPGAGCASGGRSALCRGFREGPRLRPKRLTGLPGAAAGARPALSVSVTPAVAQQRLPALSLLPQTSTAPRSSGAPYRCPSVVQELSPARITQASIDPKRPESPTWKIPLYEA